ncbi:hypothetical protein ACHAXA_009076 [Cyclostephanos tholiformis]|uniref:NAD(P)-binding protein n=1 Tax=Cyclostephanos tholiformis TaxID=382380 RepID=A0ABD3SQC8_9STRA
MTRPRTAVVVGATNGIGKAISCHLAREGYQVIAVGRGGEGRRDEVLSFLEKCSAESKTAAAAAAAIPTSGDDDPSPPSIPPIGHEFRPCDAFDLSQVKTCASDIVRDRGGGGIDALVMTQGMATVQSFTPTVDGNDMKLTLHYWSRAAFAYCLLPAMRRRSSSICGIMPGGPVIMSVLSGGVHSPYVKYRTDPELRNNYTIVNAANLAGYYTDLFLDRLASTPPNSGINFVHAAPGFVNTNWGTEMPCYIRGPIRILQRFVGKSPSECAGFMVGPILRCGSSTDIGLIMPSSGGVGESGVDANTGAGRNRGVYIMNEDGTSGKLTKGHTPEAMEDVWRTTKDVLGRSGIQLED